MKRITIGITILCILGIFVLLNPFKETTVLATGKEATSSSLPVETTSVLTETKGYRAITAYGDKFIAVGTDGKIDLVTSSTDVKALRNEVKVDLNSIVCYNKTVAAVGNAGTILVSTDGQSFRKVESGINKNVNSITVFNGHFTAVADGGTVLCSDDGNSWTKVQLNLKGNIVSVTASESICIGVTDKGEIIKSTDLSNWVIFDFNKENAGYAKACAFINVKYCGQTFVIAGQDEDSLPVVLLSPYGNIWVPRILSYKDDDGETKQIKNIPKDITYNEEQELIILACDGGTLIDLPTCSKCNKINTITDKNLKGIVYDNNSIVTVGDDFYINFQGNGLEESNNDQNKASSYFDDVTGNSYAWAAAAVDRMYQRGIAKGIGNRKYNPAGNVTWADFTIMVTRTFRITQTSTQQSNNGLSSPYYKDAVSSAVEKGIISEATEKKLNPLNSISRQDSLVMLYKALDNKGLVTEMNDLQIKALNDNFSDEAVISDYAREAIAFLYSAEIMQGSDGMIHPLDPISRAEAATLIYNILEKFSI